MKQKTLKEIESIYILYEQILGNKKIILEQDIFGIDELAYNPVTKTGGVLGYGYDRGYRVKNQIWSASHDRHLHISFTDKNTAMAVLDKAKSLGLRTAENPYAMSPSVDPDVHARGPLPGVEDDSFHYRSFGGSPLVGKGVDITGNHEKIVELILWIESTYAGNVVTPSVDDGTKPETKPEENGGTSSATAGALAAGALGAGALATLKGALSSKDSKTPTSSTTSADSDGKSMYFKGKAEKEKYGGKNEFPFSFFG